MCDIVFEKTKGGGGTVNRTSVYAEIAARSIPWRRCYKKFFKIYKKTSVSESVCRSAISLKRRHFFRRYFLVNFTQFVRTSFLQSTTGRLLLIVAVSIVLKGELANETVNYDRSDRSLCQKCKLSKRAVQVKEHAQRQSFADVLQYRCS